MSCNFKFPNLQFVTVHQTRKKKLKTETGLPGNERIHQYFVSHSTSNTICCSKNYQFSNKVYKFSADSNFDDKLITERKLLIHQTFFLNFGTKPSFLYYRHFTGLFK